MSDRALEIFERLVGYKISADTYRERYAYDAKTGHKLRHGPFISLVSVIGRTDDWIFEGVFGRTSWASIDVSLIGVHRRKNDVYLTLPVTLFGTHYTELDVTYTAGLETLPQDVQDAVSEIEALLQKGEITEWNVVLPDRLTDVIDRYRNEVE